MVVRVCMSAVCPTATIIYHRPIAVKGAIPGAYSSHSCVDLLVDDHHVQTHGVSEGIAES